MSRAPVILFSYNRAWHTRQTLEALKKNRLAEQSDLFVFSDGPKNEEEKNSVEGVRNLLRTITGFHGVTIVERERNLGLSRSVTEGTSEIIKRHGRAIILEDDMVTSPYFLSYMNEALDLYENEEDVISIHGYMYPVRERLPETFFIKGADCWGWATWERGWDLFEPDGEKLLSEIKRRNLGKRFDMNGTYPYTRMLRDQIRGRNDSWAIRWYASALTKDKFTLFPGRSLVSNIGLDASGTHCGKTSVSGNTTSDNPVQMRKIPVEEDLAALGIIERHLRSIRLSPLNFLGRQTARLFRGRTEHS